MPDPDIEKERLLLIRACNCWLAGELIHEVTSPADFYDQMRGIRLLANSKAEEDLRKAQREFDALVVTLEPKVEAYMAYGKRWDSWE